MKSKWAYILIFFVVPILAIAAKKPDSAKYYPNLGLQFHKGVVLIHSADLRPVEESYPWGIGAEVGFHFANKKSWDACHCYPVLGASFTFWDYDKPDILGYGLSSMFFIEPYFGVQKNVSFSFRAGFGLSYQSRPYHPEDNPDNLSYSTYLAFPLLLGISTNFWLSNKYLLSLRINYNHFSNGGFREPNGGINWPTFSIGINRYFKPPEFVSFAKKNWRELEPPQTRFDVNFFLAVKQLEYQQYAPLPGIEVKASRQIARISALTAGLEWMYDSRATHVMQKYFIDKDGDKVSAAVGHEFLLGKFLFSQQLGFYIYKPWKVGADLYQRYGLVYRINSWLSFGVNLKAHGAEADFLDGRIGMSFNK